MEQKKEYYAFISYKREDEKWAKWLQNKLEHYKFPTNLNGRTDLPKNIRPTFRDVTDLTPGLLAEEIDKALRSSEWLIVICSPRSAKSPWVCKEAQTFIDLGRADHIIPFVIEGNPFSKDSSTECYPEALLNLTDNQELLAANINEMGRDAAAIKVVARMFYLRFDTLWQRRNKEHQTKKKIIISIVSCIFIFLSAISIIFMSMSSKLSQDNATLIHQSETITKQSEHIIIQKDSISLLNEKTQQTLLQLRIENIKRLINENKPYTAILSLKSILSNNNISSDQKNKMEILYYLAHDKLQANIKIENVCLYKDSLVSDRRSIDDYINEIGSGISPDKKFRAKFSDYGLEIVKIDTEDVVLSIESEDFGVSDCVGFQILGISRDNRFILSKGDSRTEGWLFLVDCLSHIIHKLSTWYNYDIEYNDDYYNNGEIYDSSKLLIYGPAGVKLLALPDFKEIINLNDHFDKCEFSDDGKRIKVRYENYQANLITNNIKENSYYINNKDIVWDISYSQNGYLALGTEHGIVVWDIQRKRKIANYLNGTTINSVEYSNNGNILAASSPYTDVFFIDALTGTDITPGTDITLNPHMGHKSTSRFQFSPNDKYIAIRNYFNVLYSFESNKIIHQGFDDDLLFINDSVLLMNNKPHIIRKDSIYRVDYKNYFKEIDDMKTYTYKEKRLKWFTGNEIITQTNKDSTLLFIVYPDQRIKILHTDKVTINNVVLPLQSSPF